MPKLLTVKSLDTLKPGPARREVPDGLVPGLYFVIQPTGGSSWAVPLPGRRQAVEVDARRLSGVGLVEARTAAREALRAVAEGKDPSTEKKAAREAQATRPARPSPIIGRRYRDRHVRRNLKASTVRVVESAWRNDILPVIGGKKLADVTRADVVALIDAIVDKGHATHANRVLSSLKTFYRWCEERGAVDANPAEKVRAPSVERARDRVLTDAELKLFWQATERAGWPFGAFGRFALLTACRRDEIASMTWAELSPGRELWTIPGARTKNGRTHAVPLAPAAVAVLASVPRLAGCRYVFSTNGRPISGFSDGIERLRRIMEEINGEPIPAWRWHDLRRTAATRMAEIAIAPHIIERALNHASGIISGVAAAYNRHDYS